jgi:hypothetical protein
MSARAEWSDPYLSPKYKYDPSTEIIAPVSAVPVMHQPYPSTKIAVPKQHQSRTQIILLLSVVPGQGTEGRGGMDDYEQRYI